MLRELGGALASMADGPHDERRNSLELLNNILEVLSRHNVVRWNTATPVPAQKLHPGLFYCFKGNRVGPKHSLVVWLKGRHVGCKIVLPNVALPKPCLIARLKDNLCSFCCILNETPLLLFWGWLSLQIIYATIHVFLPWKPNFVVCIIKCQRDKHI